MSTREFSLVAGNQDVLAHAKTSPEIAIAELIWNALDADATVVTIELRRSIESGPVTAVVVTDDGHGIGPHRIDEAFATHRASPKSKKRTSPKGRPMHGQNGRGRFRTFAIASQARWRTWGENELGEVIGSEVTLRSDRATVGSVSELKGAQTELASRTGTRVTLSLHDQQKAAKVGDESFRNQLEAVMAATLLSLADATVTFDGIDLDPSGQIETQGQPEVEIDLSEYVQLDGTPAGPLVLEVIEWTTDAIQPCLYLCDEDGAALIEYGGKIPKVPGVDWSGYLRWEGFARDTVNEGDLQNARASFGSIIDASIRSLAIYLAERADALVGDDIDRWTEDGTYPYLESPATLLEEAEQEGFRELVQVSRKVVPVEKEQRRLTLGMMQRTFKESPDDALHVIAKVKGLDPVAIREFRELLDRTPLTRVVHSAKLVADRVDFLVALGELLHGEDHRDAFLETAHLHRLVENNPWVFGNRWALVRSEATLLSVMREHLSLLRPDDHDPIGSDDVDRSRRRVDLLFSGSIAEHARRRRLIVELKRANLVLGIRERDQIDAYTKAIVRSPKFQGEVSHWDFWLLGTAIDDDILDSVQAKGLPPGLYREKDLPNGSSYRIWIRSWSEVLFEAQEDLRFYQEQLSYDPDIADALAGLRSRYPDDMPPPVAT